MAAALQHVIRHMQAADYGDQLFGYFFTGLDERGVVSLEHPHRGTERLQPARRRAPFATGCGRSIAPPEALRAAWNDPRVDFDTAAVPVQAARQAGRNERTFRDPATEMPVIDWYLFYNDLIPDTIDGFPRAAKEARDGRQGGGHVLLLHVRVRRRPGVRPQRDGPAAALEASGLRRGHRQLLQPRAGPRRGLRPRADHLRRPARQALVSRQRHRLVPLRRDERAPARIGRRSPVIARNWA